MSRWRAAGAVSAMTLASRLLGVVRDALMMAILGAGWVSGTFLLVWMLPNLLRRWFGEGALTASFVPAYARQLQEGPRAARDLLAAVSGVVAAVLLGIVAVVLAVSFALPAQALPMPEVGEAGGNGEGADPAGLFLVLCRLLFPYTLPICLVALYAAALNCHRVFGLPAAAPVVLNLFWIAGLGAGTALGLSRPDLAVLLAAALLVAGLFQLALVALPLWRRGALPWPRPGLPRPGSPERAVFAAMAPTVLGMSMVQISTLLDQGIAYFLIAPGAINYVHLANRLLLFPHALTAVALAVVAFPDFSEQSARRDLPALREALDRTAAATVRLTLPAAAGMAMIANDLVVALFEHGRFSPMDSHFTAQTAIFLVLGLPLLGVAQLHARAFYALGRPGVPARLAAWLVLLNLVLGLLFVLALDWGTAGLAAATSIGALCNAAGLRGLLRRELPAAASSPLPGAWLRSALATALMTGAVLALQSALPAEGLLELVILRLLLPVATGIAVYGGALWWLERRKSAD